MPIFPSLPPSDPPVVVLDDDDDDEDPLPIPSLGKVRAHLRYLNQKMLRESMSKSDLEIQEQHDREHDPQPDPAITDAPWSDTRRFVWPILSRVDEVERFEGQQRERVRIAHNGLTTSLSEILELINGGFSPNEANQVLHDILEGASRFMYEAVYFPSVQANTVRRLFRKKNE